MRHDRTPAKNEQVVLLNTLYQPIGLMDKSAVHSPHTPLHLAFSCYLLNSSGQVLLTRRALSKKAWPGVWTNSVCGHPLPEESFVSAITRRCDYELGLQVQNIEPMLSEFEYRATDASGIVEHEFCPVFKASTLFSPRPNSDEVIDLQWVYPDRLFASIDATPGVFSPWIVLQLSHSVVRQALLAG